MQVNDDFDADFACPVDTLVKELRSTLGIWRAGVVKCPVPDRNPDHVEAAVSDLLKVGKLHPVLPMGPQHIVECSLCAKRLCESVLIDDSLRVVIFLEDRRCDPRLKDKPATKVDSADFLVSP